MKMILKLSVLFVAIVLVLCAVFLNPKEIERIKDPNGEYQIVVYKMQRIFAMPGDGGLSNSFVTLRLLDKDGKKIAKTSYSTCKLLYGDLEIDWNTKGNKLWFTRSGYFNLTTGEAGC